MLLLVNFNLFRVFQVEMMQTQLYNIHLTPKKCFNPEVKTTKTIISINSFILNCSMKNFFLNSILKQRN